MTSIEHSDALAAIIPSAEAWGTAEDTTGAKGGILHYESFDDQDEYGRKIVLSQNNEPVDELLLENVAGFNVVCEGAYDQHMNILLANFFGNSTGSPAEQTSSQGDILHVMDLQETSVGKYFTISRLIESDVVVEYPSCQVQSFTFGGPVNGVPTLSAQCICDQAVLSTASGASVVNSNSDITGDSLPSALDYAISNGAATYCRIDDADTSTLNSSDDREIVYWEIRGTRQLERRWVMRGSGTRYTLEPRQHSPWQFMLALRWSEVNDAKHDPRKWRDDRLEQLCELSIQGAAIGTGENKQYTLQVPSMKIGDAVGGYGSFRGQSFAPDAVYNCFRRSAAPTPFSGVTAPRLSITNLWAQSYV